MNKHITATSCCVLAAVTCLAAGCGSEVRARSAFCVEAVTAGTGPIWRNEAILVRFSRPLASGALPQRALLVRNERGAPVAVDLQRSGRHVIIRPGSDPEDAGLRLWPTTGELSIEIPVPIAGPTFRSLTGDDLTAGFTTTVTIRTGERRLPGHLELVSSTPPSGTLGLRMDEGLRLRFNAPLDAGTLINGIQVVDRERREVVGALPRLDPGDSRSVIIQPFEVTLRDQRRGMSLFNAGARYEVVVTRSLRSRDGRRPLSRQSVSFTTRDEGPRLLAVQFGDKTDFNEDSRSRRHHDRTRGTLRPQPRPDHAFSLGDGSSNLVSLADTLARSIQGEDAARYSEIPHVFSHCPARTQVLIPGDWLGTAPMFITGLRLLTTSPVKHPASASELVVSLGYLNPDLAESGLESALDRNIIQAQSMDVGLRDGVVTFLPEERRSSQVHLSFAEPFHYSGGRRDMVVEFRHEGVTNPMENQKPVKVGVDVAGAAHQPRGGDRGRTRLAIGRGSDAQNPVVPPTRFVLSCVLSTTVNDPVVTRWYVVDDVDKPAFQLDPVARGSASMNRDFHVEYQAGAPKTGSAGEIQMTADGTPDCAATGGWSPRPPRDGSRAVRLRITFANRWYSPGEDLPEIEYILLRYVGS